MLPALALALEDAPGGAEGDLQIAHVAEQGQGNPAQPGQRQRGRTRCSRRAPLPVEAVARRRCASHSTSSTARSINPAQRVSTASPPNSPANGQTLRRAASSVLTASKRKSDSV